jgi:hypothetical protein
MSRMLAFLVNIDLVLTSAAEASFRIKTKHAAPSTFNFNTRVCWKVIGDPDVGVFFRNIVASEDIR